MKLRTKLFVALVVVLTITAVLLYACQPALSVPTPAQNVTGTTTVLTGDNYACTLTDPQFTVNAGAESGTQRVLIRPHTTFMDVNLAGTPGAWNDAYETAGVNPSGYDSTRCAGWGWGTSAPFPVALSGAGNMRMNVTMHTVHGFIGDAGLDIWVSPTNGRAVDGVPWTSGWATTKDLQASKDVTEIMVWLNSPGINRGQYQSLGYVHVGTRIWQVLYWTHHTARHPWNYIVFAAPLATSNTVTFTDHNLDVKPFITFAAQHGWVTHDPLVQNIDTGFEYVRDPVGGTQIRSLTLSQVTQWVVGHLPH